MTLANHEKETKKALAMDMKIFLLMFFLVSQAMAQDNTGFSDLIIRTAKDTELGGSFGLTDGKRGAITYLPIKVIHSKPDSDGRVINYVKLNAGGEARDGEKARALFFPSFDIVSIGNYLIFSNQWAKDHVKGSSLPPIFIGIGPSIPVEYEPLRAFRWNDVKSWLRVTASVRFGDVVK